VVGLQWQGYDCMEVMVVGDGKGRDICLNTDRVIGRGGVDLGRNEPKKGKQEDEVSDDDREGSCKQQHEQGDEVS
jgi:hypothetical protein